MRTKIFFIVAALLTTIVTNAQKWNELTDEKSSLSWNRSGQIIKNIRRIH